MVQLPRAIPLVLMMVQQLNINGLEEAEKSLKKLVSIKSWASCGVDPSIMEQALYLLPKKPWN